MIPFEHFGENGPILHLAHANGYPPGCYRQLIEQLIRHFRVLAIRQRPLWPGSDPEAIVDWQPFASDLEHFLDERKTGPVIGLGHSLGATTTLRVALRQPQLFTSLILIDPVLFPPPKIFLWRVIAGLGLADRFHPLVAGAMRRRNSFPDKDAMFANYRTKPVFHRLSDEALMDYVNAIACDRDHRGVTLSYPAEWEARIYVTSLLADLDIWRNLSGLTIPALFIYGSESDTFKQTTGAQVKRRLPTAEVIAVPNTSHLLPLEEPIGTYRVIMKYLSDLGAAS